MSDAFLGEVRAMPYENVPVGWAACNGALVEPNSNAALFSLIGYTYGGGRGGNTQFALPNIPPLAGKEGTLQYCIAIQGTYPQRP